MCRILLKIPNPFQHFTGSADLVQKFGLADQTQGVRKVNKFCHDAAYELDASARLMMDTSKLFPQGLNLESFAIVMTIKMKKGTKGNIFTMYSEDSTPVLAIEANPLQLHHKDGVMDLDVEEYITDEMWHTIAISVTDGAVEVLVDCESVTYKNRKASTFAKGTIRGGQILLGQRFTGASFEVSFICGRSRRVGMFGETELLHLIEISLRVR
jgi:hypothetical protein